MFNTSRREFLATTLGAAAAAGFAFEGTLHSAPTSELAGLTLKEASERIHAKKVSPVELTEACLGEIKTWSPKINAWITVMREKAIAQAKDLEKEQAAGKFRGPLHGIPIGLKDNIDAMGVRTTAASAVYEYRYPKEDSEVARRLREGGAILVGKNNMHEFDAGTNSAVSYWGPVRNPWNLERVSGGSSGGSAAAVAMNNCFASIATDTNGSIRNSAAISGVVGFMATHARVSMRGIVPLMYSLDNCGPITRSVEDAAMVMQQIAGYDHLDIDSVDYPVPDMIKAIGAPVSGLRIGVPPEFYDHLDDEIAKVIEEALSVLNKLTKGSKDAALPSLLHAGVSAELASYFYDLRGVNGGTYEPSTTRILTAGADARALDYIKGWRALEMIRRTVNEDVFGKQSLDVLVAPTFRHPAPTIEEELVPNAGGGRGGAAAGGGRGGANASGDSAAAASGNAGAAANRRIELDPDMNTRPFNGYGFPTISIPCGFTASGMPVGLQIAGPRWAEGNVIALAYAYQQATEWHKRRPPLTVDTKVPALSKAAKEQTGG